MPRENQVKPTIHRQDLQMLVAVSKVRVDFKLEVSGAVDRKTRPPREMFGGSI
jgi:hypothetical protein